MKNILIAAAALAAFATTSYAADLPARMPVKAMPAPVVESWTGCYIGAGAGYGMWNQDHNNVDAAGAVAGTGFRTTTGGRGYFGTVQGGCDYQFNQTWLIGAFADGNWGSERGDFQDAFGFIGREKERWAWAGGGRVGYLLWPTLLTYGAVGYTEARFDQINFANSAAFIYPRHTYGGYFLATGYEYKLTWLPGFTWKTEYRFSDLGRDSVPLLTVAGAGTGFFMNAHKYDQTIRSELVWRFNSWTR